MEVVHSTTSYPAAEAAELKAAERNAGDVQMLVNAADPRVALVRALATEVFNAVHGDEEAARIGSETVDATTAVGSDALSSPTTRRRLVVQPYSEEEEQEAASRALAESLEAQELEAMRAAGAFNSDFVDGLEIPHEIEDDEFWDEAVGGDHGDADVDAHDAYEEHDDGGDEPYA